jgi:hypothetical protein
MRHGFDPEKLASSIQTIRIKLHRAFEFVTIKKIEEAA